VGFRACQRLNSAWQTNRGWATFRVNRSNDAPLISHGCAAGREISVSDSHITNQPTNLSCEDSPGIRINDHETKERTKRVFIEYVEKCQKCSTAYSMEYEGSNCTWFTLSIHADGRHHHRRSPTTFVLSPTPFTTRQIVPFLSYRFPRPIPQLPPHKHHRTM